MGSNQDEYNVYKSEKKGTYKNFCDSILKLNRSCVIEVNVKIYVDVYKCDQIIFFPNQTNQHI